MSTSGEFAEGDEGGRFQDASGSPADTIDAHASRIYLPVRSHERHPTAPLPLEVALGRLGVTRVTGHGALADADPDARNTLTEPGRVVPHEVTGTAVADGTLSATLEPLSWNVIRLA
ncbi:alpha-L-arabinofuranosidase C-terminal domain-containing protein [Streptomyces longwoodensis]|uniref:alpha-L-arabinofuranosidase C-terminal domain-containing protein n=1 Tax=Streptomyces longwoodensis TaxID=68231 RepID=UPI0033F6BA7B